MSPAADKPQASVESHSPASVDTAAMAEATPRVVAGNVLEATRSFHSGEVLAVPDMPQRIGRYRVVRLLGVGGFGNVWLASDDELQRQVAIKLVPRERFPADAGETFYAEARALAALDHPHILPVYDVGRTESGAIYVVSKFIAGPTLRQQIQQQKIDPQAAARIVKRLADALQHAHRRNLIHRDIKPANILVESASQRVYLADFGLAGGPSSLRSDEVAGTPAYMSPEQAAGEPLDARSDLFSLGVVFYELLTGQRPFAGHDLPSVLKNVLEARPTPICEMKRDVPQRLAGICERLLSRAREQRHRSGEELASELQRWEDDSNSANQTGPGNLTAPPFELIGRDGELDSILQALSKARLVTLTGPGGVGKTSLAKSAADRARSSFPDGVFLVELAALSESSLIATAAAQVVGCLQNSPLPAAQVLVDWLKERRVLLVLDNCEHLDVAPCLGAWLETCPGLRVIVTSRAALRIGGEHELPLSLLSLPDVDELPAAELLQFAAVRLFVQRAREVLPEFQLTEQNHAAIAEICRRLDGLPLAIELAAARIKYQSPQSLRDKLRQGLQVLASRRRDAPQRQQTLRQTIAWSYDLLEPEQQRLFRSLSVFCGGFTLRAAEEVAGGGDELLEDMANLIENNLLRRRSDAEEDRFQLLETIREFAFEALAGSGESEAVQRRHATWVQKLAEDCEPLLRGPEVGRATALLHQEHGNIRAALAWCLTEPIDANRGETGLRIGGALWRFWCTSGYLREGHQLLVRLLAAFGERTDALGAKARYAAGCLAEDLGEFAEARQRYVEALQGWERARDEARMPDALIALGSINVSQGDYVAAGDHFQRALALSRQHQDLRGISVALSNLGSTAWSCGDYQAAHQYHQEALAIRRQIGNRAGVSVSLTSLGLIASRQGDLQAAKILYQESLAIARELDNRPGIAVCLNNLGEISYRLGEFARGEVMLWEALHIQHQMGDRLSLAYTLESLAAAAAHQGSNEAAVRFFAAADALRQSLGTPLPPRERESNDKLIYEVRIALGPDRFAALWTTAQVTPLEELVESGKLRTGT
jgi:non-specific serine/threonine protein kinase